MMYICQKMNFNIFGENNDNISTTLLLLLSCTINMQDNNTYSHTTATTIMYYQYAR